RVSLTSATSEGMTSKVFTQFKQPLGVKIMLQQVKSFTLPHANGQQISLSDYRGKPVVITFSGRASQEQVRQIRRTVRTCYTAEEVPVLQVAHLEGVPKLFRDLAKKDLQRGFEKEAQDEAHNLRSQGKRVPDDLSVIVQI